MKKQLIATIVTVPLVMSAGVAAASAATTTIKTPNTPTTTVTKSDTLSVATRTVKGTMKTKRYIPRSFKYTLSVPTLEGVAPNVKKAFDSKINALISRELKYYAKGAVTKAKFTKLAATKSTGSTSDYAKSCRKYFKNLTGDFESAIYKGRYASIVLNFTGVNAACRQLDGLWMGYLTDRSVTIDTQTGQFMQLTDFTSNRDGKINTALKNWNNERPSYPHFKHYPKLSKNLKICDRPGNISTEAFSQKHCFSNSDNKTGPVAWLIQNNGLRLTFPTEGGYRHALLNWKQIPSS